MLIVKKYFSLALVALLISSVTGAQTRSPEAMSFSEFLRMISNQPDCRVDWTGILNEPAFGIKATYRIKLARKQGKIRREIYPLENETRLKNKADKNYRLVMIEQPGQPPVAFDPQAKTYTEMPGESNAPSFDLESFIKSRSNELNKIKIENVGLENFNGHPATKIRITFEGESEELFMYFAKDMDNLFIGFKPSKPENSSLTVSNISFDVADELFQLPQGYKKVDVNSFQATLKQKVRAPRPSKYLKAESVSVDPRLEPPGVPGPPPSPSSIDVPVAGDGYTPPVLLNAPKPNYTAEARRNKVEGFVIMQITIGADGSVKKAFVINGLPDGLNQNALKAAYQQRYKPAMKNGRPVKDERLIQIDFKLDTK